MRPKEAIDNIRRITRDMTPEQKKKYFRDYYLGPLLVVLFILILAVWFIVDTVRASMPQLISGLLVNVEISEEMEQKFTTGFEEYYATLDPDAKKKGRAFVSDTQYIDMKNPDPAQMNPEKLAVVQAQMASGNVNYLYTDKEIYDIMLKAELIDDSKTVEIFPNYIIFTINDTSPEVTKAFRDYILQETGGQ